MAKQTTKRNTKETEIIVSVDIETRGNVSVATGVPFLDHILTSMAFHGGFLLEVKASGDTHVDPHHLVEDIGLVLGDCLKQYVETGVHVHRYGSAVIPMDDALSEVIVDVCGRPYLEYRAAFPQERSGDFDMWLLREFFLGLTNRAAINLHAICRYGRNSHHMAESLFKALGISLKQGYAVQEGGIRSTKGLLHEGDRN